MTGTAAAEYVSEHSPVNPAVKSFGGRRRLYGMRVLGWMLVAVVVWVGFIGGVKVRRWAFDMCDPIRFSGDLQRGVFWGLTARGPEGYLNQFDKMDPQVPEWQDQLWVPWLDYGPLRLLVMRQWAVWQMKHFPPASDNWMDAWQRTYEFNWPVLMFNACLEGLAAICAFFLTRLWVIRGTDQEDHGHFCGIWQGIVAAMCVWYSADIIISAHGWFQWDSWVVPWYLCACLLGSLDWWFAAGMAVAIGVNLKGQMLSIAPIFIIWPLVAGRYGGALRWICGMAFGVAVITSGWMLTYIPADKLAALRDMQTTMPVSQYPIDFFSPQAAPRVFDVPAAIWIFEMLLTAAVVPWLVRMLMPTGAQTPRASWKDVLRSRWAWIAGAAAFIMAMVYWPWLLKENRSTWYLGLLAGAVIAAAALFMRRRNQKYVLAGIAAGGLLSCMALFHGSTGWWDCGFHYGSIHWPWMVTGPASNVPAYFEARWGWAHQADQIAFVWPMHWGLAFGAEVTAKMMFDTIYTVLLILSGIAIGLQARRKDRRMLVALVTPWLMFFLFPVQIQERYLLYASGAAACCIGESVGMALLGLLITLMSAIMHLIRMMDWNTADLAGFGQNLHKAFPHIFSEDGGQAMLQYLQATVPDMMWALLVIGMVFMYLSFVPSRRRRGQKERATVSGAAMKKPPDGHPVGIIAA